ncbi:hypothetical protein C8R44DRAFT_725672 [Mycena epipterygia]|nr:hypothetical protein C8R44DRAFT_725672 [Mycena epipterygia]
MFKSAKPPNMERGEPPIPLPLVGFYRLTGSSHERECLRRPTPIPCGNRQRSRAPPPPPTVPNEANKDVATHSSDPVRPAYFFAVSHSDFLSVNAAKLWTVTEEIIGEKFTF